MSDFQTKKIDYKAMHDEVNAKRDEIFDLSIEAVKDYVRKHGAQTNPFIETLWIDVSDWEIKMWYPRHEAYIDELYYIPSTDELGFIIYEEDTNKVFKAGALTRTHYNIVTLLFDIIFKIDALKS